MLKAVIIDDEVLTVLSLRDKFPWNNYGVEIVGVANDGESAYHLITKVRPDIVITDIRLPFMDGLKLTELIKQVLPGTAVILISAFSDFEYAKKAISIGGDAYLLKPVDEYELETAILEIKNKISKKNSQERSFDEISRRNSIQVLWTYIRGGNDLIAANQALKKLGLEDLSKYLLIHFVINEQPESKYTNKFGNFDNNPQHFFNYLQMSMERLGDVISFGCESNSWTALAKGPFLIDAIKANSSSISQFLEESNVKSIGCYSKEIIELKDLPRILKRLNQVCSFAIFNGSDSSIIEENYYISDHAACIQITALQQKLINEINNKNLAKSSAILSEGLELANRLGPEKMHLAYEFCYTVWQGIRMQGNNTGGALIEDMTLQKIYEYQTLEELKDLSLDALSVIDPTDNYLQNKDTPFDESIKYIHSHYSDNISLDILSKISGISKNYYCYKFKRDVGKNIWTYLTELRIEKAKSLLLSERKKIYEVAYLVGYDNPSYFSKQFKNIVGVSPQEFIQNN